MEAFEAIKTEAEIRSLPEAFVDDLNVHDHRRLTITADPPEQFGWVLRKHGTLLLDARMGGEHRRAYVRHLELSSGYRCYFWDGRRLEACASAELMAERMERYEDRKVSVAGY